MQVGAEPAGPAGPQVKKAVGQFPRFEAAQAQAGDVGVREDGFDQVLEVAGFGLRQVAAVGAQVHAGEDRLLDALAGVGGDFLDHGFQGAAAAVAAQAGDDAEGAAVVAAVLDLDEGAGALEAHWTQAFACLRRAGEDACAPVFLRKFKWAGVGRQACEAVGVFELGAPGFEEGGEQLFLVVVGYQGDAGHVRRRPGGRGWRSSR